MSVSLFQPTLYSENTFGFNNPAKLWRNQTRSLCEEELRERIMVKTEYTEDEQIKTEKTTQGMEQNTSNESYKNNVDGRLFDGTAVESQETNSIPTCVVAPTANMYEQGDDSSNESGGQIPTRKQREFIPENKKDEQYWEKRRKNNDAARRSREKRRMHDTVLENRIVDLSRDNCKLRNELFAIKRRFGLPLTESFLEDADQTEQDGTSTSSVMDTPPVVNPSMLGYMDSTLSPRQQQQTTAPPPLIHMGASIPVGVSVPSGFGPGVPMPLYVAVPSNAEHLTRTTSASSVVGNTSSEQVDQPPPAHSHLVKREDYDESSYERESALNYSSQHSVQMKSLKPEQRPPPAQYSNESKFDSSMSNAHSSYPRNRTDEFLDSKHPTDNYSDDNSQDQPLSLTVRKRVHSFSGNESSTSVSSVDSPLSQSPPTTALPHKLRHKIDAGGPPYSQMSVFGNPLVNGLAQLSEIALAQSGALPFAGNQSEGNRRENATRRHRDVLNPRSQIDPRYAERRRRNNEAARKCRENRKHLTSLREVKSGYLENENGKLRNELDALQEEMKQLREMLERKRFDKTAAKTGSEEEKSS